MLKPNLDYLLFWEIYDCFPRLGPPTAVDDEDAGDDN
jgi:hypothetical protein